MKRLGMLVVEWAVLDLQSNDSERGRFLREEAETMMAFDEPTRKVILRERKRRFPQHEYEFLKNCIDERWNGVYCMSVGLTVPHCLYPVDESYWSWNWAISSTGLASRKL